MKRKFPAIDFKKLEEILKTVEKPGRYVGGEWNERRKNPDRIKARVALAFPDVYEIGMSYLGQKVLYEVLNAHPHIMAERVYAPWVDFEEKLRRHRMPLYSLENKIPLRAFDILGFSLLYELNYTNVLTILDTAGIPLLASQRDGGHPLVIAGGPAAFNPEPVAGFFDLFLFGDGEESFLEIIEAFIALRAEGRQRGKILAELSKIRGAYVPSLYETSDQGGTALLVPRPRGGAPARMAKRVLESFRPSFFPERPVVPSIRIIHDRAAMEVARGCPQRCRFCQASSLYFPHRPKDPATVIRKLVKSLRRTGYEDSSLSALSISDYPHLEKTVEILMKGLDQDKVSLSLSSLRPKGLSSKIVSDIARVRKTGFTLVPEAGTERLRRVINKELKDSEIRDAVTFAFSRGWQLIKLYFMVGLPSERDEDLEGIITLVENIIALGRQILNAPPRIHLSVSSFIPKPHTPFQWLGMDSEADLIGKHRFIRERLGRYRSIEFKDHPVRTSLLEAVISRGDRRTGGLILEAWKRGARFDGWKDRLESRAWDEAFSATALRPEDYLRAIPLDADLPWDIIDTGLSKDYLKRELEKALREEASGSCLDSDCRDCRGCRTRRWKTRRVAEPEEVMSRPGTAFGRATDSVHRFRAIFSKTGQARFISHLDLINTIQRTFRRAGIPVLQSCGFHPKMVMSFGPALALGMEGRGEVLEFKSHSEFGKEDFLSRINRFVPKGIAFGDFAELGPGAPSLNESMAAFEYALDLKSPVLEEALRRMKEGQGAEEVPGREFLELLLQARAARRPGEIGFRLDVRRKKLFLRVPNSPGKSCRPQDFVREVFGIDEPAFVLCRQNIVFR